MYHDDQNHFGTSKTQSSLNHDFLRPGIMNDVKTYVQSCNSCTQNKFTTQTPAGFLHPLPIQANRVLEITLNFISPLPESAGYNYILIMTDQLTNYVLIKPTIMMAMVTDITSLFYETWYHRFSFPAAITSDHDKLFVSKF